MPDTEHTHEDDYNQPVNLETLTAFCIEHPELQHRERHMAAWMKAQHENPAYDTTNADLRGELAEAKGRITTLEAEIVTIAAVLAKPSEKGECADVTTPGDEENPSDG